MNVATLVYEHQRAHPEQLALIIPDPVAPHEVPRSLRICYGAFWVMVSRQAET